MRSNFEQIRCQRCRAANPLGEELCGRCGTRLMLIVEPNTLRFEEEAAGVQTHDQLFERVSMLENRLLRFAEKLEKGFELLLKQSQLSMTDHTLLETLIGLLEETGRLDRKRLETSWLHALNRTETREAETSDLNFVLKSITDDYEDADREAFVALVSEGLELIEQGKAVSAKRPLERAAALAPGNATLNFIIGLQFFREGKLTLAHAYLQRAHDALPASTQTYLLLGVASGDAGEVGQAKSLLGAALAQSGASFAVHYALGRLAALEGDWKVALAHFKSALVANPCAEAHYLVGFALGQLGRFRTALRHLNHAVALDENYGEAFQLLGFLQAQLNEPKQSRRAYALARALGVGANAGAKKISGTKRPPDVSVEMLQHQFFGAGRHRAKRLLTGGQKRLAALLREDALAQVGCRTLTPAL